MAASCWRAPGGRSVSYARRRRQSTAPIGPTRDDPALTTHRVAPYLRSRTGYGPLHPNLGRAPAMGAAVRILVVREVTGAERVLPMDEDVVTIGRGAECTIRIESPYVSRYHARIEVRDDGLMFVDLGSHNGSLYNGARVEQPVRLNPGDMVTVGRTVIRYGELRSADDVTRTLMMDTPPPAEPDQLRVNSQTHEVWIGEEPVPAAPLVAGVPAPQLPVRAAPAGLHAPRARRRHLGGAQLGHEHAPPSRAPSEREDGAGLGAAPVRADRLRRGVPDHAVDRRTRRPVDRQTRRPEAGGRRRSRCLGRGAGALAAGPRPCVASTNRRHTHAAVGCAAPPPGGLTRAVPSAAPCEAPTWRPRPAPTMRLVGATDTPCRELRHSPPCR